MRGMKSSLTLAVLGNQQRKSSTSAFMPINTKGNKSLLYVLLAGMVVVLIAGCGESKPPAAAPIPAVAPAAAPETPSAGSISPAAEPAPPIAAPAEPKNLAARKLDPEKIKRGEAVYRANCANCHGPNGEATPGWRNPGADGRYPPPPLDGSAHAWHHSTETLERMIRVGSPADIGGMPSWDGKLTNQQIDDVIVWIKSLWPDEVYDIWHKEIENKPEPKKN
ncbi:mono/diheme cytochrome c family protein [Nitrosospira sp. Nsp5]|uniref:Cytochrome c, mono-and diheme variants n=2 Tax=Nitrosomonadaceae TaxID=206379 RepID=A0ABY0T9I7_9PROT|nr:mono/diheme cytochrome c family protein [Nitrosospira sp. Nsp5]SDQ48883.1 Cytochrome c, mono-and diheme variants [Nitrosospira multiformis]